MNARSLRSVLSVRLLSLVQVVGFSQVARSSAAEALQKLGYQP